MILERHTLVPPRRDEVKVTPAMAWWAHLSLTEHIARSRGAVMYEKPREITALVMHWEAWSALRIENAEWLTTDRFYGMPIIIDMSLDLDPGYKIEYTR